MTNEVESQSHAGHMIPEIPDPNTLEVATYGSEYARIKSMLYVLDMMEEVLRHEYNMSVARIHGERYERIRHLLRTRPFVISQHSPHVESFQEIEDIRAVKELVSNNMALRWVRKTRMEVETYGVISGTQEYGRSLLDSGLSNELYRRAIRERASRGFTGDYESVRRIRDGRDPLDEESVEARNVREMNEAIILSNEYARSLRDYPEDGVPMSGIPEGVVTERDWLDLREEELRGDETPYVAVTDHDPMADDRTDVPDTLLLSLIPGWEDVPGDGQSGDLADPDNPDDCPDNPDVEVRRIAPFGTDPLTASGLVPYPMVQRVMDEDEHAMLLPSDPELREVMLRRMRGEEVLRIGPWTSTPDDAHRIVMRDMYGIDVTRRYGDTGAWFDGDCRRYECDDGTDILIFGPLEV